MTEEQEFIMIAKFMKKKFRNSKRIIPGRLPSIKALAYKTSWDWLMPVIEKIAGIPCADNTDEHFDTYYPITFGMINEKTGMYMFRFNRHCLFLGETLIKAAYEAVIEFLKDNENLWKKNKNLC